MHSSQLAERKVVSRLKLNYSHGSQTFPIVIQTHPRVILTASFVFD
jgi:hypothetical protein